MLSTYLNLPPGNEVHNSSVGSHYGNGRGGGSFNGDKNGEGYSEDEWKISFNGTGFGSNYDAFMGGNGMGLEGELEDGICSEDCR